MADSKIARGLAIITYDSLSLIDLLAAFQKHTLASPLAIDVVQEAYEDC